MSNTGSDAVRKLDGYVPRVVDSEVASGLRAVPAVVIDGPRACGKTSTGREHARSEVMFSSDVSARLVAEIHPNAILEGREPRLLDEWQLAPEVWNQVRAAGDDGRRPGRFMVIRDLRVYAQSARARVAHYRDSAGLEIDAIVERRDGAWIAIEVKLGGDIAVDAAASALLKLRDKVDADHVGSPSNLIVVTATGFGYLRPDGVQVLPITVLGP